MSDDKSSTPTRRQILKATAGAAAAGSLGVVGAGTGTAKDVTPIDSDISVTIKLYPHKYSWFAEEKYAPEAKETLEDHLVPRFDELGVELDVEIVPERNHPDVDELQGGSDSFKHFVREETNEYEHGNALHMWVHTYDDAKDGGPNTPGSIDGRSNNVDGQYADAYTDMAVEQGEWDEKYRKNTYLHEALHGFMEDGKYDFACPGHNQDYYGNTSEHTCGYAETYLTDGRRRRTRVSVMVSSYRDDELGDLCDGKPSLWSDDREYTLELSDCTMETLRKFFEYNEFNYGSIVDL